VLSIPVLEEDPLVLSPTRLATDWKAYRRFFLASSAKPKQRQRSQKHRNDAPTRKLYIDFLLVVAAPYNRRNFLEIEMNVLPADIWVKGSFGLKGDGEEGDCDVEENFDAGKAHESNESVGSDVAAVG
jgi:hypothetical protein